MTKQDERLGIDGFTYTDNPQWQAPRTRWGLLALAVVWIAFIACTAAAVLP